MHTSNPRLRERVRVRARARVWYGRLYNCASVSTLVHRGVYGCPDAHTHTRIKILKSAIFILEMYIASFYYTGNEISNPQFSIDFNEILTLIRIKPHTSLVKISANFV